MVSELSLFISTLNNHHHRSHRFLASATMAKIPPSTAALLLVAAVTLLPSLLDARHVTAVQSRFIVRGRVFCDTCLAGFETPASTYLAGAKVRVECRWRANGAKTCSFDGETDSTGTYNIPVRGDHEFEMCESVLVSSPDSRCSAAAQNLDRAPVFLTSNNGIASNVRFANSLGFKRDAQVASCTEVMKQYELEV